MLYLYCGEVMDIKLEQINMNTGIDGLEVLNEIAGDDTIFGESPIPEVIDEYLYKGFLLLSEEESLDESNPIYRYFIVKDNSKIGYADINMSVSSNIGIVLLKKYRSMGLGKDVFSKLLEEAYNKGLDDIVVATDKDNVKMRNLCASMGGNLTDIDGQCHYIFKNKKTIKKR